MTVANEAVTSRSFATATGAIYAGLWAATLAGAAITTAAPGARGEARHVLGFALAPRPGSLHQAAEILATNSRIAMACVLCAVVRRRLRAGCRRALLDAALIALAGANAALVGCAAAAYGPAALPLLVHLPIEWAAFAVAGAVYAGAWPALRRLAACGALLALAAGVETFITP